MNKLFKEIVKTDLKNDIESGMLNPQQQLIAINQALKDLARDDNEQINDVIKKYREVQLKQETIIQDAQTSIMENAKNIYDHLMKEL